MMKLMTSRDSERLNRAHEADRRRRSRPRKKVASNCRLSLVTLRNHGTDNLGRAPSHGTGSREGLWSNQNGCITSRKILLPSPFRLPLPGFFSRSFYLCLSLFFPFLLLSSSPRVSAHVVYHFLWDDVDVFSKASLVSAFCRDRRGLRDTGEGPSPVVNRPFFSVHGTDGFHIRVTYTYVFGYHFVECFSA